MEENQENQKHQGIQTSSSHNKSASKEGTITLKKSTIWKIATFVFAGLFVLSIFTGGFKGLIGAGSVTGGTVLPAPTPTPGPSENVKVNIGSDDPVLGDKNAGISIVEFSDFQCPFCARVYSDALAQLRQSNYFKNGEVNLVYKHFPLNSIHPQAQKAAEASECARKQGKFWEYHDLLFTNQQALDIDSLKTYASQLGLNSAQFNSCLEGGEAASKVSKDLQEATAAGGRGTPYFVLVNKKGQTQTVSGAVPWSNFEAAIKALQ